jgi:hypothetical protein
MTALNLRTVKVNSLLKEDLVLKRISIAIGVIGLSLVLVLGIAMAVIKRGRGNVFVKMIQKVILWIVLILVTLMVI